MINVRIVDRDGQAIASGLAVELWWLMSHDFELSAAIAKVECNPLPTRVQVGGVIVERC